MRSPFPPQTPLTSASYFSSHPRRPTLAPLCSSAHTCSSSCLSSSQVSQPHPCSPTFVSVTLPSPRPCLHSVFRSPTARTRCCGTMLTPGLISPLEHLESRRLLLCSRDPAEPRGSQLPRFAPPLTQQSAIKEHSLLFGPCLKFPVNFLVCTRWSLARACSRNKCSLCCS